MTTETRGHAAMTPEEFDAWMRRNGWSVRSLAARMGVTPRAISHWRCGDRRVDSVTALALETVGARTRAEVSEE